MLDFNLLPKYILKNSSNIFFSSFMKSLGDVMFLIVGGTTFQILDHHHSFNVSVPLKMGCTAPMFVPSYFLHSILFAGSALDSFQFLRSLLIISFHVFFGLPRPRCPSTSNSVMLLIQPSFFPTGPHQRSRLYRNKVCMLSMNFK